MSDLRVALVAEGPTDAIVIEAALKALLPRPFVLTQLQPESIRPWLGEGWGGVLRWCRDFATRGYASFEMDSTMPDFDLFVVHVDADVAEQSYRDVSEEIASTAIKRCWPNLPNKIPCPPPNGSANAVRACILSWTGMRVPGPKTVLCVPSKAVEAWVAAAAFRNDHASLTDLECNLNLARQLAALPKGQRIKKAPRQYRARAGAITSAWPVVRQRCSQAERFSMDVLAVAL